jgi:hypothetical protein
MKGIPFEIKVQGALSMVIYNILDNEGNPWRLLGLT